MSFLRILLSRCRALRRGRHADRDLDDELRAYLEARAAFHEERGLAPHAALRAARLELEGVEQVKERVRDVRAGSTLEGVLRDVRYGARALWRSPGYAAVVILTLALGIGLNAAIFSVVHAVLWRSLPYPDADRLVVVEADTRALPSAYSSSGAVFDVRAESRSIVSIAQAEGRDASVAIGATMERVAGARVTDDLLPLLGATPMALGRSLDAAQDAHDYVIKGVVISHELWQRLFAGDPGVIGRRLTVNNFDAAVVGVLRQDFRAVLPAGTHVEERVDVWMPRAYAPTLLYRGLTLIGRIPHGATVAGAQAEVDALTARFAAGHPSAYPHGLRVMVRPLGDAVTRDVEAGAPDAGGGGRVRPAHRVRQRRQPAPGAGQDPRARARGAARPRRDAPSPDSAAPGRERRGRHPRRRRRPAAGAPRRRDRGVAPPRAPAAPSPRSPSTASWCCGQRG